MQLEKPNNLHTLDELFRGSITPQTSEMKKIEPRKKFDHESSSEVRKMLGCSNRKFENCTFICRHLASISNDILVRQQLLTL